MTQATSKRPYLIRAMHEWMTDNGLTPYVVVDAGAQDLLVPERYISDGKIVLNVSYSATRDLDFAAMGSSRRSASTRRPSFTVRSTMSVR